MENVLAGVGGSDAWASIMLAYALLVNFDWDLVLNAGFIIGLVMYQPVFWTDFYWFKKPVKWVDTSLAAMGRLGPRRQLPFIVLFYPVLRESPKVMETTLSALADMDYPAHRFKVIAIPNENDLPTVAALRELQTKLPYLEMITVPDPKVNPARWAHVWDAWNHCKKAYWWHQGAEAGNTSLPPKKTRQLIYSFYKVLAENMVDETDLSNVLIDYIDADSCPPKDHFMAAALGMNQGFDVLQAQNVAGNMNKNMATAACGFDHLCWDGDKYPHQSSGTTPYWVLGKGLFYKASDLLELGGFHPWVTIEDPEVGLRFWKNGKKLGIIRGSLIEEVPDTFGKIITQRKRWVAGFFQTLTAPLDYMEFTFTEKLRAWLIFLPCLSLAFNIIGLPLSALQAYRFFTDTCTLPTWTAYLSIFNLVCLSGSMLKIYVAAWGRTRLVLDSYWQRVGYMLRVNPVFVMAWWFFWTVPLAIGFYMFLKNKGLVWERTVKVDDNRKLVRELRDAGVLGYEKSGQRLLTDDREHMAAAAD